MLRSVCGAIEDLSELAIPILKKERLESNPPGFETTPATAAQATSSASASGKPSAAPDVGGGDKVEQEEKREPERPPGDFGVRAKEEHTEEKDPVELVKAESKSIEGDEVEEPKKKKKRKRKHKSGPSTKKEKRKKKEREAAAVEEPGAGSTASKLRDPEATTEEKDHPIDQVRLFFV